MKKNVIAMILTAFMALGNVGTMVPALASETAAQESVAEEEENEEVTTAQESVAKEENEEDTTEIENLEEKESTGTEDPAEGVTEENEENAEDPSDKNDDASTEVSDQKTHGEEATTDMTDSINDDETEEYVEEEMVEEDEQDPAMAGEGDIIDSGACGENLTWTLGRTGTLRISGTGRMNNYADPKNCPWYSHREAIETLIIDEGVTYIGNGAFEAISLNDGYSLKEITFPSTLKEMGITAFGPNSCMQMSKKHITSLENWLSIIIDRKNRLPVLGGDLYIDGILQSEITIPDGFTTIPEHAFYRCNYLTRVNISESVVEIGDSAIQGCARLSQVDTHEGLEKIGAGAFQGDINLKEFIIPSTVTALGNGAFMGCGLTKMVIPGGISGNSGSLGQSVLAGCNKLEELTIMEGISIIYYRNFTNCSGLKILKLPKSVKIIQAQAFNNCNAVTDIYYAGSESDWKSITKISSGNDCLFNAVVHYNCGLSATLSDEESVAAYTGLEIKPLPRVESFDGEVITAGTDYTVSYENNIEPGTAKVIVTGIGDYLGQSATVEFIIKKPIEAELSQNLYYFDSSNGDDQVFKPQPIVTSGGTFLSEKKDYTVEYKDNTSPGEATAIVTGTGDYAGTVELPFYLATISGLEKDYEYTGKAITPIFTLAADKELQEGADYSVRYEENIEPGKEYPRIIVTGSGDYSGELIIPFIIKPRAISQLSSKTGTQREINIKFEEHPCADGYIVEWRYAEDGEDKEPERREIDAESLTIKDGNSKEKFEITTDDEGNRWCEFHGDSMPRAKHAVIQVQAYAEVNMPDETVNYVKSDPSKELTVATGNQVIRKEMWGFVNYGEQRTSTKVTEICGQAIAAILTSINQGGQCFGMCWVGPYSVIYGDKFGTSTLHTIDSIENAAKYTDHSLRMNAAEAIEYGQALQFIGINGLEFDHSVILSEDGNQIIGLRLQTLYDRISACQNGTGDPIGIGFYGKGEHAVLGMGISYEDNKKVEIDVYDPNYTLDEEPPKLTLYKVNGSLEDPNAYYEYYINGEELVSMKVSQTFGKDDAALIYFPINQNIRNILNDVKSDSFTPADSMLLDIQAEDAIELINGDPILSLIKTNYHLDDNRIAFWVRDDRPLLFSLPHATTLKFGNSKINHEIILTTYGECNIEIVVDNPSYPSIKITPIDGSQYDIVSRFFDGNKVTSTSANISSPANGIVTVGMQNDGVTITGADEISCTSSTGTISGDGTVQESEVAALPVTTVETDGTYNYALFKEAAVLKHETGDGDQTSYNIIYHDHVWDEGIVTVQPTVTSEGEKLLTCELCGETTTTELAKIEPISIDKTTITGITDKIYTGKAQTQSVVVKYEDAKLIKGTDFTVSYKNNTNAGTASVIITGIGNYSGTVTKTFRIKKAANTITAKSIVKSYSAQVQTFDLGVKVKNGTPTYKSDNKSVTVSKAGKVTVKAKFIGNANITIKSPASTNYTSATKTIVIKVMPTKTKFTSVTNIATKKMKLTWVKRTNATGYIIQYSTSSTFDSAKTVRIDKYTTVSTTIGNLVKGKKYYVRIKTFKTVSGTKYYSGWSDVMSVTIKK